MGIPWERRSPSTSSGAAAARRAGGRARPGGQPAAVGLPPMVAKACLAHGKHMVTTSYVKDEMKALNGAAKKAGVVLLNELGVDPVSTT